jgi:hypothetical protein
MIIMRPYLGMGLSRDEAFKVLLPHDRSIHRKLSSNDAGEQGASAATGGRRSGSGSVTLSGVSVLRSVPVGFFLSTSVMMR